MKRCILVRRVAQEDLAEHADFIARDSPSAAGRFVDAVKRAFELLAESPSLGKRYEPLSPSLEGLRRFRVSGFENYLIFYRPIDRGIEVIRVLHGARDIESIFE